MIKKMLTLFLTIFLIQTCHCMNLLNYSELPALCKLKKELDEKDKNLTRKSILKSLKESTHLPNDLQNLVCDYLEFPKYKLLKVIDLNSTNFIDIPELRGFTFPPLLSFDNENNLILWPKLNFASDLKLVKFLNIKDEKCNFISKNDPKIDLEKFAFEFCKLPNRKFAVINYNRSVIEIMQLDKDYKSIGISFNMILEDILRNLKLQRGKLIGIGATKTGDKEFFTSVCYIKDNLIACTTLSGSIYIIDFQTGQIINKIVVNYFGMNDVLKWSLGWNQDDKSLTYIAASNDGKYLAVVDESLKLTIYENQGYDINNLY